MAGDRDRDRDRVDYRSRDRDRDRDREYHQSHRDDRREPSHYSSQRHSRRERSPVVDEFGRGARRDYDDSRRRDEDSGRRDDDSRKRRRDEQRYDGRRDEQRDDGRKIEKCGQEEAEVNVHGSPKPTPQDHSNLTEEELMAQMMGFGGFDSTKDKVIPGNKDLGIADVKKKRGYKQVMNRVHKQNQGGGERHKRD